MERMQGEVRHHCGLFGIVNHPDAAELTYFGMHAQQHRGQEAAGMCRMRRQRPLAVARSHKFKVL